jgi:hypothetical protein
MDTRWTPFHEFAGPASLVSCRAARTLLPFRSMAGKRQHFVPRFLQAGFASKKTADQVFTWVYRKDQLPFESNTLNIGVEREFYSIGADTAADDAITDVEDSFSTLVSSLRNHAAQPVADPRIPELISHLEIRTRHLRQSLASATDYLLRGLAEFFTDTPSATTYLMRQLRTDPELLRKPLAASLGCSDAQAALLIEKLPRTMLEPVVAQYSPMLVEHVIGRLRGELQGITKSSNVRALKGTVSPATRSDRLRTLHYATVEFTASDLILGDSIVLFEVAASRRFKTLLEGKDELTAAYLPLSPKLALVGATTSAATLPRQLPEAIARSSFEYFISDRESDDNRRRQITIGEAAALITEEELDEIIKSSFAK